MRAQQPTHATLGEINFINGRSRPRPQGVLAPGPFCVTVIKCVLCSSGHRLNGRWGREGFDMLRE